MANVTFVGHVQASKSFDVCAYFLFAEIDWHICFHFIFEIKTHLFFQELFGIFQLGLSI